MDRARILVADTDPDFLKRFSTVLSAEGHRINTLRTGSEALRAIATQDIDVLLVDLALGDETAANLIKASRAHSAGMPLQVIMTIQAEEDLERVLGHSTDDILTKSASGLELTVRLQAAMLRLDSQRRLVEERERFRKAVKEEEAVTARVLDRNEELKRACRSLESIKRELERSNQRLKELASYDMLSGLLNRVSLFSAMDVEIERARRRSSPLAGFMTDIDNFKNINDNWGHPYGDAVIREIGDRLTRSLRKYDHAGRYGGEEFFIILPETGIEGAQLIAERFRKRLTEAPVRYGSESVPVTASIGVTQLKDGESRDAWVTRADQAMYLAKQQGRNRTCVLA